MKAAMFIQIVKIKNNQHNHNNMGENILFLVVDLFCGAGGTTSGFEEAEINGQRIAKVIACVNHDRNAILSHKYNNPWARHFIEDIRVFNPARLLPIIEKWKRKYPNAKVILWASLECTNFSIAKGGLPRDADSRTLADYLYKYREAFEYDAIMIENVMEFMSWGALDKKGKPISKDKGRDFMRWKNNINFYGYQDNWQKLNAADYGATQSRKRLFGLFASEGFPAVYPNPTHSKYPEKTGLKKWIGVRKDLDLEDEGESIFTRKKPLVKATLKRIYEGLIKHVAGGKAEFISTYYSGDDELRNKDLEQPLGVITTNNRHAVVKSTFISKYYSGEDKSQSIDKPVGAITCIDHHALVNTNFIAKYFSNGKVTESIEDPLGAITTKDRNALIKCDTFISNYYSATGQNQSIDGPVSALTTVPKSRVVKCWVMNTSFNNTGSSIDEPCPTILASRKHHYLVNANSSTSPAMSLNNPAPTITTGRTHYIVNPSWFGTDGSVDNPCCTIVARQDKAPISIVNVEKGEIIIPIYEDDSEYMIKIKEFMAAFGIVDIKMRMLKIPELLRIQGFRDGYTLHGTKTQQKKYIGNAVVPLVVKRWAEAIGMSILSQQQNVA